MSRKNKKEYNAYMAEYMRKKYRNDPTVRKADNERSRKFRETHPTYHRDYMRKRNKINPFDYRVK